MSTGTLSVAVCLKWVPTRVEVAPLSGEVAIDDRFSGISPADAAALEWALRLADRSRQTGQTTTNGATTVLAVTAGPPVADRALRTALAAGATSARRVEWPEVATGGSRAVACALAGAVGEADLVLCGDYSLDRGSGSVPAFLAHELGYGQALGCVALALPSDAEPRILVTRRLDRGRRETLALTGPTVVSFEGGIELRRASLPATVAAGEAPVDLVSPPATSTPGGPVIEASGPYRPRARALPGPRGAPIDRIGALIGADDDRASAQHLELDPPDAADAALEALRRWGYLTTESNDRGGDHHHGEDDGSGTAGGRSGRAGAP